MIKKEIVVCILNKNDGKNLNLLRSKIINIKKKYKAYLIDSNSTDNSLEICKMVNLKVIDVKNLSRGEAIIKCINLFKNNFKYIIFTSSDGEEDLNDISKFKIYFKKGFDLVIASRTMPGGKFKSDSEVKWIFRKIFLKFINFMINKLFKSNLHDCWNGFRGIRLNCFNKIKITEKDYLVEAEMTIKFLKNKLRVTEFPTIELPRKFGKSSNPTISSGFGHIKLLMKEYFI